jgi:hypothetical protein
LLQEHQEESNESAICLSKSVIAAEYTTSMIAFRNAGKLRKVEKWPEQNSQNFDVGFLYEFR